MAETPVVVRFDTFPLDLTEPVKLFERSEFNYFHRDDEHGAIMGFWDVEHGEEWVGEDFDLAEQDEVLIVLEGRLFARIEGGPEEVAGPGDAVMVLRGRRTHVRADERTRAFFIVYGTDPAPMVRLMGGAK